MKYLFTVSCILLSLSTNAKTWKFNPGVSVLYNYTLHESYGIANHINPFILIPGAIAKYRKNEIFIGPRIFFGNPAKDFETKFNFRDYKAIGLNFAYKRLLPVNGKLDFYLLYNFEYTRTTFTIDLDIEIYPSTYLAIKKTTETYINNSIGYGIKYYIGSHLHLDICVGIGLLYHHKKERFTINDYPAEESKRNNESDNTYLTGIGQIGLGFNFVKRSKVTSKKGNIPSKAFE